MTRARAARPLALIAGMILGVAAVPVATSTSASESRIVRLDPQLDSILPNDTVVERIVENLRWLEGPLWDARTSSLLFSDIPDNAVYAWHRHEGLRRLLQPSGYTADVPFRGREPGSNGLAFDPLGRLVLCQHGDRRIARRTDEGGFETVVDRYRGRRLNSPNDLVFARNGDLYFTDPPFGLVGTFDDPERELDFAGVFRLSVGGQLSLLTAALSAPNGIALSPTEDRLYVSNADADAPVWWEFPLARGSLGEGRVLHDASALVGPRTGLPDGLVVDDQGRLFAAGPRGVWILDPSGVLLGRIDLGGPTGNCAWGEDGATLFVTSGSSVFRVRTTTHGAL